MAVITINGREFPAPDVGGNLVSRNQCQLRKKRKWRICWTEGWQGSV